ncbi:hypothetical protein LWI29_007748 [Acer saccharum]|uniref:RPW8 domain-containing protein n=1 Tax=Acer saccharum TaxID=4024 RepID=A0AA39TCU7_ACESA|nr:hypothetical protein LWI29_007748 [Acer saccharum]KAK1587223.1 hypothetical protein Q3G72_010734 [Acer saccharum]
MSGIEAVLLAATPGIAFQLLYDAIRHAKTKTRQFEDILTRLQNTVKLLAPKINEIDRLNKELENSHKEEIVAFVRQLVKAKELVITCSVIPSWNLIKQYRYAERLDELDSSLQRLLNVEFQAAQCHDILKILAEVTKMNHKLDEMNFPEKDGDTGANAMASTNHGNSTKPSRLFEADYKIKIKNFNMHLRFGI